MEETSFNFGILDQRFLAKSVGLLDPSDPLTLSQDGSLKKALRMLKENRIGGLIVTDMLGKVQGIFTERDVILKIALSNFDENASVSEFMTTSPQTIKMTDTIAYALQLMSEQGYRHLPIVDEEEFPVGIISVKDIVDYIVSALTRAIHTFADQG